MFQGTNHILREIVRSSGIPLRELEARSGIKKSKLSNILSGKTRPTDVDIWALSATLDFDAGDLFRDAGRLTVEPTKEDLDAHASARALQRFISSRRSDVTLEDMLVWHDTCGGRLVNMDKLLPFVAIFYEPDPESGVLDAVTVGQECLAAESLQTRDPSQVIAYMKSLPDKERKELTYTYTQTSRENRFNLFQRNVIVNFPGAGLPYELRYTTALFPVRGANNHRLVINYSVFLSARTLDQDELIHLGSERNTPPSARTPHAR